MQDTTAGQGPDPLEQAKRYTDDAFEIAAEECKALREEVELLRERIEELGVLYKQLSRQVDAVDLAVQGQGPPRVDGMWERFDPSD